MNVQEFELYPAIDIQAGKAVRLYKGDYDAMTVYHDSPAAVALQWESQGASYIHVVDLDGAKEGNQQNRRTIEAIVEQVRVPVQIGGGIRSMETLDLYFSLGA